MQWVGIVIRREAVVLEERGDMERGGEREAEKDDQGKG